MREYSTVHAGKNEMVLMICMVLGYLDLILETANAPRNPAAIRDLASDTDRPKLANVCGNLGVPLIGI